jgi:hypothetical protein
MAQEIVINVKLEDAGVVENLNKIETELAALNKERDALLGSNLSTDALTKALSSVDGEINKLNGTYQKITQSTNSYKQAQDAQAQSQQKTIDSQKRLETSIRVSEGVTKTLAGSVNLVTSALATFGVENEEVAQTLLKLQAAASFATGIKDLVEGYKALAGSLNIAKVAQAAYNAVVAANPYVLAAAAIAALVVGLVAYSSQVDDTKTSQEKFDDEVERSNRLLSQNARELGNVRQALKQNEQALQNDIDLLKAQGASNDVIAKKQEDLLRLRGKNATELIDLTKKQLADLVDLDTSFSDAQIANTFKRKVEAQAALITDTKERNKFIEDEEKKLNDLFTQLGDARSVKEQAYADLAIFQAQRVTDANKEAQDKRKKKEEETTKTLDDNEKARAKLRADTTAEIIKDLDNQTKVITENNNKQLDVLKQQLIEGKITEETFAAEKVLLDKKTNEEIIKLKANFQLTDLQQFIIGAENEKAIRQKNGEDVIKLQRANADIELGIIRSNNQNKIKTTAEGEKARIETFEREYLNKKIELLNNEELKEQELAEALKELELQKSKDRLDTLIVGSSEYLALKAQIIEQELALDKSKSDEQKKIEEANFNFIKGLNEQLFTSVQGFTDAAFQFKKNTLEKGSKEEEKFARKQFKINKALSLSSAIISGFLATLEAYKNGMKNPVPLLGPATAGVYAALAAVSSGALIAKIASTKFEGGASSGGATAPSVPSVNVSGSISPQTFQPDTFGTGISQQQTFGGSGVGGGGNVMRAYVTESDITSTNLRLNSIRNASEL